MTRYRAAIVLSILLYFLFLPENPSKSGDTILNSYSKLSMVSPDLAFAQEVPAGQSLLDEGITLFKANKFKEAIDVLREFTSQVPDNYLSYYYLGFSYFRLGNIALAKDALTKSTSLNPNFVPAHMGLGSLYEREGELDQARKEYEAVISVSKEPDEARAAETRLEIVKRRLSARHIRNAQQFADQNDPDGAIRELSIAGELTPQDVGIHVALGGLYIRQN